MSNFERSRVKAATSRRWRQRTLLEITRVTYGQGRGIASRLGAAAARTTRRGVGERQSWRWGEIETNRGSSSCCASCRLDISRRLRAGRPVPAPRVAWQLAGRQRLSRAVPSPSAPRYRAVISPPGCYHHPAHQCMRHLCAGEVIGPRTQAEAPGAQAAGIVTRAYSPGLGTSNRKVGAVLCRSQRCGVVSP
ncbi:hypothetical protein LNP25_26870 [Klebsiella variicola subsp. variicola]|nr:hypothetical protein [Klebsiella variicola subsp. variicola]